eukprot:Sspe_Gene.71708::Locus_42599_Transcript_1_1_Confidence_1.000_Length_543::g.71708::m.71708
MPFRVEAPPPSIEEIEVVKKSWGQVTEAGIVLFFTRYFVLVPHSREVFHDIHRQGKQCFDFITRLVKLLSSDYSAMLSELQQVAVTNAERVTEEFYTYGRQALVETVFQELQFICTEEIKRAWMAVSEGALQWVLQAHRDTKAGSPPVHPDLAHGATPLGIYLHACSE